MVRKTGTEKRKEKRTPVNLCSQGAVVHRASLILSLFPTSIHILREHRVDSLNTLKLYIVLFCLLRKMHTN